MSAILQGDLRVFPTVQLLPFLAEHRHSGALVVSAAQRQTRLFIHEGKIAWLEGDGPVLGIEAVLEVLEWREGTFEFLEGVSLPVGRESLDLDVQPLVEEGQRRERERLRILNLYPDDRVTFRVADPSDKISLTPAEFKVIFRLGQGETLAQLCQSLGRSPVEVYPLLYNLEANGLVAVVPVATGEATTISGLGGSSAPRAPQATQPLRPPASSNADTAQMMQPQPGPPLSAPSSSPARPEEGPAGGDAARPLPRPPKPAAPPAASLSEEAPSDGGRPKPPSTLPGEHARIPEPEVTAKKTLIGSLSAEAGSGAMHPLMSDEVIVGRDAANGVNIPDGSVSTRHARITRTPDGFVLEDLNSRNGTFVNGDPLKEKRLLVDNDVIRFGRVVLTYKTAKEIAAGERTIIGKIP